jgi:aspartyl-tRNA(Asn)/glutamyl-tRNA(Gln) amidotransferase subunit A
MKENLLNNNQLYYQPAYKLAEYIRSKQLSAEEVCKIFFQRIDKLDPSLGSFLLMTENEASAIAKGVDKSVANGERISEIAGVPVAVKDNMNTKGIRTTCASKMLENYIPIYTATAVEKIFSRLTPMLGKTNMDEFAFGSSTENSAFQPTKNPWNIQRVPGGSSGGSAAAVAAGLAPFALGSDTGGSIRQPASLCGIVGLKPTYGRVSRYGLVAFASSLDQIGPLTGNVRDCALLLKAIAGHDRQDSTCVSEPVPDYTKALTDDVKGLKIGIPKEFMVEGLEPGVREAMENSFKIFERLGANLEYISLPSLDYATSVYYIIASSEAGSNLSRFDGVRYGHRAANAADVVEMHKKTRGQGFGSEAKRRIMLGTYALSAGYYEAFYGRAQKVRTLIIKDFNKAFSKYDVLISPTSPSVAFKLGEKVADPLKMYLSDICTNAANLAGIPALSLPCGLSEGLPVGLQIMGKILDEETVLKVGHAFETAFEGIGKPPRFL